MLDIDTFLTTVYVMVDDFCKQHPDERIGRPGPVPSLTANEVITLGIFAQWNPFPTERAFYRLAHRRVRPAFPRLPHRRQFNRLLRQQADEICRLGHWLVPGRPPHPASPPAGGRRARTWLRCHR